jgi:hypothetical protein
MRLTRRIESKHKQSVYRPRPFSSTRPALPILLCDLYGISAASALKSFLFANLTRQSCDMKKSYRHEYSSYRFPDRGAIKAEMPTNAPGWVEWIFNHPPFFVLYFIALWALVNYILGQLSGWAVLSRRFRDSGAFYSYQWSFQSIRMRTIWGNYSNCVNFGADEVGLYMGVFPLFRIGHPPLFITWSEIQVLGGNRGWIFKKRKLLLGRHELIPLVVSLSLAEKLKEASGKAWPVETNDM